MRTSGWVWSSRKRDLDAAKWWGCESPSAFYNLDKEDRLDILALYELDWRISAINNHEQNEEMKSKNRRRGKRR